MSETINDLPTPSLLIDEERLRGNIRRMQAACDAQGVHLWPHVKTHKTVEIARMQLEAGAQGLVCAKLGEAEALLPSGVRRLFIAYPLVDSRLAPRLRAVADALEELIGAVTSIAQAAALESLLKDAGIILPVLMGVDTGLGRDGIRGDAEASELAAVVLRSKCMRLVGLYTHEGHAYGATTPDGAKQFAEQAMERLRSVRTLLRVSDLTLWPGCSITATAMANLSGVHAVRPGTYVFGDLLLSRVAHVMTPEEVAASVLTTVVDRPSEELALLDGGSKTFSSDRTPGGVYGSLADGRDIHLTRLSEEHGWVTGSQVNELRVGERVRVVPAHICPAINLTDELMVVRSGEVADRWRVAARGRVN